jgi:hypothetical protein
VTQNQVYIKRTTSFAVVGPAHVSVSQQHLAFQICPFSPSALRSPIIYSSSFHNTYWRNVYIYRNLHELRLRKWSAICLYNSFCVSLFSSRGTMKCYISLYIWDGNRSRIHRPFGLCSSYRRRLLFGFLPHMFENTEIVILQRLKKLHH